LPEPVDVIVSDIRGSLPFFQQIIPDCGCAAAFLAPGNLIPRRIPSGRGGGTAGVVKYTSAWSENVYGLDLRPARSPAINNVFAATVTPENLLAPAQCWWTLDYHNIENPNARAELTWTVARTGTAHGIVAWFDTILAPGVAFSNGPGEKHIMADLFPLAGTHESGPGDWSR
jgi:protein arginine N-methyltransferase 1